jgi:two-component system cell cycle sensor histidine kinase/response regulator CckA
MLLPVLAHHGVLEDGVQFLQKPFTIQNLAEKVREVLESTLPPPLPESTPR